MGSRYSALYMYALILLSMNVYSHVVPAATCTCVNVQIWTSQLKRTVQSAKHLSGIVEQWKALNELEVVGAPTNKITE